MRRYLIVFTALIVVACGHDDEPMKPETPVVEVLPGTWTQGGDFTGEARAGLGTSIGWWL